MHRERIRYALARLTAMLRNQGTDKQLQKLAYKIATLQRPTPEVVTQRLTRLLEENLLPFWYPDVVDKVYGGYRLHHDQQGAWLGPCAKGLVSQARTLWFFSRLVQQYPDHRGYREAADHGFAFLQHHLWDPLHGGFFWEVAIEASEAQTTSATDARATEEHTKHARTFSPVKPGKHLYGQAFGLYALSTYAQATAKPAAKALAAELFALLEANAYDCAQGGYQEFLQRNWEPVADSAPDYRSSATPSQKTQDTHLHLLEGLTAYVELISDGGAQDRQANDNLAKARLTELIIILTSTVQRPLFGVGTDVHLPSWQPKLSPAHAQVIYGHELEKIWLLTRACHAVNLSPALLLSQFRGWFSVAYSKAFDHQKGGFFEHGYLGCSAHVRLKNWWTQAEGMLAAMQMYRHTGDLHYYAVFSLLLDWIENTQADWVGGDWHRIITPAGEVEGNKADNWKTPYHNGRALLECLHLLNQIEPGEIAQ